MTYIDQPSAKPDAGTFDTHDRGLLLADGVFDTSLILGGRIMFADAHRARLLKDTDTLAITVDPSRIDSAITAALEDNTHQASVLRITITRGAAARGLSTLTDTPPTVLAHLHPFDAARLFAPVQGAFTSIRRNETSPTSRTKTLAYLDNVLALQEVQANTADEALFLNTSGGLACGATSNLFLIRGNTLLTPRTEDGALPGTVRQWVLDHARNIGLAADTRTLSPDDLTQADAAFVTNSLRLIAPLNGFAHKGSSHIARLVTHLNDTLRADGFNLPEGARLP